MLLPCRMGAASIVIVTLPLKLWIPMCETFIRIPWHTVVVGVTLTVCFLPHSAAALQADTWHIRGGVAYASPDGSFQAQRANGKVVTSDIDEGVLFSLRVERQLTRRLGLMVGGLGLSNHNFIIHQDFPDGTEFEARDGFRFKAVTAGVALHFFQESFAPVVLEPFLLFAWYDDVSIASAGPPYDRTVPIDIDVNALPGIGMITSLEIPVGGPSVTFNPWVGLAAVRFTGPFPDDPSIPGSGGDIGVGFSPLMVGASLGLHF